MIKVSTLDNRKIAINADHIERVENVPETIITLTNGKKLMVRETMEEIIEAVIAYRIKCSGRWQQKQ
ncbi:MAG: flagellar FlbD family protein [Clostridia bacterium]|jgi:flagellar protein FlbD|nr:flagellar FlbD family protein [Clostridia bacterium]